MDSRSEIADRNRCNSGSAALVISFRDNSVVPNDNLEVPICFETPESGTLSVNEYNRRIMKAVV